MKRTTQTAVSEREKHDRRGGQRHHGGRRAVPILLGPTTLERGAHRDVPVYSIIFKLIVKNPLPTSRLERVCYDPAVYRRTTAGRWVGDGFELTRKLSTVHLKECGTLRGHKCQRLTYTDPNPCNDTSRSPLNPTLSSKPPKDTPQSFILQIVLYPHVRLLPSGDAHTHPHTHTHIHIHIDRHTRRERVRPEEAQDAFTSARRGGRGQRRRLVRPVRRGH